MCFHLWHVIFKLLGDQTSLPSLGPDTGPTASRGLLHDPVPPFLHTHHRPPPTQLVTLSKPDPSHSVHGIWKGETETGTADCTPSLDPAAHSAVGVTSGSMRYSSSSSLLCLISSLSRWSSFLATRTALSHAVPLRSKV